MALDLDRLEAIALGVDDESEHLANELIDAAPALLRIARAAQAALEDYEIETSLHGTVSATRMDALRAALEGR